MTNSFREKLEQSSDFVLTFELVPGRSSRGGSAEKALDFARQAARDGLLDALTITDNPGGNPSLSPDVLGREINQIGIDVIVHFACRDRNRYGAFSRALQLDRLSIENLLVLSGDYPIEGPAGTAKPCFDLGSVTMLCMLDGMNRQAETFCAQNARDVEKTNFYLGAAVSCFKYAESEIINQYYKLLKKVHNGARFAITQICYDARKFDELVKFLLASGCEIPVLGSVCVLNERSARFIHQGGVPGAFLPEKLVNEVRSQAKAPDKGKRAFLTRSAKLLAVLKGLGYRGAHLMGVASYEDVRSVIVEFRQIEQRWRDFVGEFDFPYPDGFCLYEKDQRTGLNGTLASEKARRSLCAWANQTVAKTVHSLLFNKDSSHGRAIKHCAEVADKIGVLQRSLCVFENVCKWMIFQCRRCGDCALPDMAYLCPESQCPKFLRNGACGGSEKGRCEVRKDKPCVWVKVYERLKTHKEQDKLKGHCIPPRNWALDNTSSWLNFHLGRDYHARVVPYCERARASNQ